MQRYLFEISYVGTNYHGWQKQDNAVTVQEIINECLAKITKENANVVGSGRTDTGVHCKQQFFHQDLAGKRDIDELKRKLNAALPYDISIGAIMPVKNDINARFDAISRSYEYHINRTKDPFSKNFSYYYSKSLSIENMNDAATLLCGGEKDFEAFSKVKTQVNNFNCIIHRAFWKEYQHRLIFHITANRFLRGMVRAIVGTLLDIGEGKRPSDDIGKVLDSKDRRQAGRAVPAHGLYLTEVIYPPSIFI